MDLLLLAIRIGLAGVLLVASLGKLMDLRNPAGREAMEAFGVPPAFAPAAAIALPVVELVLGILLLPVATAWWAGLGVCALMLLFMAGIARQMAQGNAPDCHCFGQLHSAPAGPRTLVRNGLFAAAAAVLIVFGKDDPGIGIAGWFSQRSGADVALLIGGIIAGAAIVLLGWAVFQLMSQAGRLLTRIEALEHALGVDSDSTSVPSAPHTAQAPAPDLPVGSAAPEFTVSTLDGEPVGLASLRNGGIPLLLIFTSPDCTPCTRLMPDIARWQREGGQRLRPVVVGRGDPKRNAAKAAEAGVSDVLVQPAREVSTAFGATSTPSAVVVMPDGRIGSPLARGATAVRALADAHLSGTTPPSATIPHPGTPATNLALAPQLALPALDGTPATLATLGVEARPVVLVFTDPHCEPCDALLPELLAWQRNAGERAQLALVSRGSVDENRLMGDRTGIDGTIPILIQHGMETIAAYGIHQAPAAVLVTRGGRWDGQPAYGETGVRSILQRALSPEANGVAQIRHHSNHPAQQPVPRPEIGEGDRVPLITLPDLAGSPRPLIDPNGLTGDRVLLFWRATCGYCQRMLPRLRAWEATRAAGDPELIVIATSSAAEMTLQGFASHVLLDHGVGVGRRFGSRGTPSAVRVSAEGVVVAPIASGAEAVLRLIDDPQRQTRDAADSLRT